MVARTQSYGGDLLVTFATDGEEPEQQLAATGERALKIALLMIAKRDVLRPGDKLTVEAIEPRDDLMVEILRPPHRT